MLYFICTTGNMVPVVPDTFSCPSKSSRIFIKSFLFLFISSYYGRSSVKVPLVLPKSKSKWVPLVPDHTWYPYLTFLLHVLLIFKSQNYYI